MERHHSTNDHVTTEQALDKVLRAAQARFTGGISPIALTSAFSDWALHLVSSPGKQLALLEAAAKKAKRFGGSRRHRLRAGPRASPFPHPRQSKG